MDVGKHAPFEFLRGYWKNWLAFGMELSLERRKKISSFLMAMPIIEYEQ